MKNAVVKMDFVAQRGLEPPTSGSAGQRSDPLSYGRMLRVDFAFASRRLAPDSVWTVHLAAAGGKRNGPGEA